MFVDDKYSTEYISSFPFQFSVNYLFLAVNYFQIKKTGHGR